MIKLKNVSLVFQGGSVAISNLTTTVQLAAEWIKDNYKNLEDLSPVNTLPVLVPPCAKNELNKGNLSLILNLIISSACSIDFSLIL